VKKLILGWATLTTLSTQAQIEFDTRHSYQSLTTEVILDSLQENTSAVYDSLAITKYAILNFSSSLYVPAVDSAAHKIDNIKNKRNKTNVDADNLGELLHVDVNIGNAASIQKTTATYFEVPLVVTYKTNTYHGFFASVGSLFGLGIGVGNKNVVAANSGGINTKSGKIIYTTDDLLYFNAFDLGATFAAGYELTNEFTFKVSYNPNFSNLAFQNNPLYKNRFLLLSAGFRF
jgi:hypothetical protein